jgi:hypothetical protein
MGERLAPEALGLLLMTGQGRRSRRSIEEGGQEGFTGRKGGELGADLALKAL